MLNEPTIHQIEKLLKAFREQGGSDAEINALAQDIVRDYRPEKIRKTSEIFGGEQHPTIKTITGFKKDGKKPLKQFLDEYWNRWYIKYPLIFGTALIIVFMASNLPLYWTKLQPVNNSKQVITSTELVKPEAAKSAPLEASEIIPAENTLVVSKIGVRAPIVFVETANEKAIESGLQNGVVHYYQTAEPGKVGNSFITGHSSNYWWDKGAYNYVFANLDKLAVGDQAVIYYKGNKYLYQASKIKIVEATDLSVLDQTIKPTLTLMTCTPPGTSWKRLIVEFDQIAPVYKAPTIAEKIKPIDTPSQLPASDSNPFWDWVATIFNLN